MRQSIFILLPRTAFELKIILRIVIFQVLAKCLLKYSELKWTGSHLRLNTCCSHHLSCSLLGFCTEVKSKGWRHRCV